MNAAGAITDEATLSAIADVTHALLALIRTDHPQ